MTLKTETRDKLKRVSTATLATALYKRGFRNQMIQGVQALSPPKADSMVGEAYTLRYIPAREDLNDMSVFRNHAHPQRKAVEECPPGAVMVIDSRKDAPRCLRRRHPGHAAHGPRRRRHRPPMVASVIRQRSPGWTSRPTTTGPAPPPTSRCTRRSTSTCRSAAATPRSSRATSSSAMPMAASSCPRTWRDDLAAEATEMTAYEDFVTERVRAGHPTRGLYPPTDEANLDLFKTWREKNGR